MTIIIGDITMSLDGFVTGPGADVEHGVGHDADGLHAWALESDDSCVSLPPVGVGDPPATAERRSVTPRRDAQRDY